jgi:8-oxo-dGTP diphosphatase
MAFCYDYAHPAVTTDVVVFTVRDDRLVVLLIQRAHAPFAHCWALPGGFIEPHESLEQGALRELKEETGLADVYLEQLYTFGQPNRDPRERVISVAYIALAPIEQLMPVAASDAVAVRWFDLNDLPQLAFDHRDIILLAHQRLRAKLDYSTLAFHLLDTTFTFGELQQVYEVIRGAALDKRNFRKLMRGLNWLEETGKTRRVGQHKPAKLYRLAISCPSHPLR